MNHVPINLKPYQGLKGMAKTVVTPIKMLVPINLKPYQGLKGFGVVVSISISVSRFQLILNPIRD